MYASTPEEMAKGMSFHASEDFIIACGCVTIDPKARKVLLVVNKKFMIHQLPKGRKNIGEDLLAAALRETYEETGVRVWPLPAKVGTRATPTKAMPDGPVVTTQLLNSEPCAVTHMPDPYSGAFKHVFYFIAQADSTLEPEKDTQDDWENLEPLWVDAEMAPQTLTFRADAKVVEKALADARRSGIDIP